MTVKWPSMMSVHTRRYIQDDFPYTDIESCAEGRHCHSCNWPPVMTGAVTHYWDRWPHWLVAWWRISISLLTVCLHRSISTHLLFCLDRCIVCRAPVIARSNWPITPFLPPVTHTPHDQVCIYGLMAIQGPHRWLIFNSCAIGSCGVWPPPPLDCPWGPNQTALAPTNEWHLFLVQYSRCDHHHLN